MKKYDVLNILLKHLKEGLEYKKIGGKVKIGEHEVPSTTFYSYINIFKEHDLIYERKGKYYWKFYQVYRGMDYYKFKLNHSLNLLKPSSDGKVPHEVYENSFLLEHIFNGYSEIYEKYMKLKESEKKYSEGEVWTKIESFILNHGFKLVNNLSDVVEREIYRPSLYSLIKIFFNASLKIIDKEVRIDGEIIIDDRDVEERNGYLTIKSYFLTRINVRLEFLNMLSKLLNDEEIREKYVENVSLERKIEEKRRDYQNDINLLALKAMNGVPLRGFCRICEELVSSEESNEVSKE